MALTRPRGFEGQVRGVSHHGQETHLHKQAGYIDADFPSSTNFSLAVARRTIHLRNYDFPKHAGGVDDIFAAQFGGGRTLYQVAA